MKADVPLFFNLGFAVTGEAKVFNVQDKPELENDLLGLFILDCPQGPDCSALCQSTMIEAIDRDNVPSNMLNGASWPLSTGLTYTFAGASEFPLGYATLSSNQLTFCVTNVLLSGTEEQILIRITDTIAWSKDRYDIADPANYEIQSATNPDWPAIIGNQFYKEDSTIVTCKVFYTAKNGPILTDACTPEKFHPDGEEWQKAGIFEGEAIKFCATWADYWTNNPASTPMPLPCMFGVEMVVWNVYDTTAGSPNFGLLLHSQTNFPPVPPVNEGEGGFDGPAYTSLLPSDYIFDTSSDRWFVELRTPWPHDYQATISSIAYDVCGNTSTNEWDVKVKPTLEYPVITFANPGDMELGATGTFAASEHNGNPIKWMWYPGAVNPGELTLDKDTGAYTATRSGTVSVKAFVYNDNQNLAGAVTRTFDILVPESYLPKTKVIVITGNDTNESCYGEVTWSAPTPGPWAAGTPISFFAQQTKLGIENGGFTFLRWALPDEWNNYLNPLYWYNLWDWTPHYNPYVAPIRAGVGIGDIGLAVEFAPQINGPAPAVLPTLMAIFKKTSELAVPVVNDPLGEMTDVLPCLKIGEDMGSFSFKASATVQSEDFPGIEAIGLPEGLSFSASFLQDDRPVVERNNHEFGNFTLSGTPTVFTDGPVTVTLYATNGFWQVGHRDKLGRDIVGTFIVTVLPKENPIPDQWSLTAPLTPAKETKLYADDEDIWFTEKCLQTIPDVQVCSDTPVILGMDNLPAGLVFTSTMTPGEINKCGCYKDGYDFSDLLISGTPDAGTYGTYEVTLYAVNDTKEKVTVGTFKFVVLPLVVPLVDPFNTVVDCQPKLGHAYAIDITAPSCDTCSCGNGIEVMSDSDPVVLVAQNLPPGMTFTYVDGYVNDVGNLCNEYFNEYDFCQMRIAGTPTAVGTYTVTLHAQNATGLSEPITTLEITVAPQTAPMVKQAPEFVAQEAHIGWSFEYVAGLCDTFDCQKLIVGTDASGLEIFAQGLPAGVSFMLTDIGSEKVGGCDYGTDYTYTCLKFFGVPTVDGIFHVKIFARNVIPGDTLVGEFDLVVQPKTAPEMSNLLFDQVLAGGGLGKGRVGRAYDYSFAGDLTVFSNDGTVPTFVVTGLPAGLTFNFDGYEVEDAAFGKNYIYSGLRIVGIPSVSGTFPVTFTTANTLGSASGSIDLLVKPHAAPMAATIETPVLCNGKITKAYAFDFPVPPHHPITVTSDIPVKLQLAGLPAGLAFTYEEISKQVGDSTTDNLDTYTFGNLKIAGTPTVSGAFPLTLKAVNGINPDAVIAIFTLTVDGATVNPRPTSLTQNGTFDGWAASGWRKGIASMSIKKGTGDRFTLSGKFMLADQGYTFKADQNALTQTVDGEFLLKTYVMVKAERVNITLQVLGDRVTVVANDSSAAFGDLNVEMFRNNWATWDDDMPDSNYYTVALPSLDGVAGSGYLAMTVYANGTIKAAGKLADGTARSFSSVLLTVDGRYLAVLYTAPVTYKGGYFFGVVEFVYDYEQGKWIVQLFETTEEILASMALSLSAGCSDYAVYPPAIVMPAECVLWVNNDPKATANYNDASDYDKFTDYKDGINHGFVRALDVVGGQYSDTVSLQTYYVGNVPEVADLLYTFRGASCSTCSEERSAQASSWNPGGLMITGWTAPKADTPKKTDASLVWPEQPNFDFYTYGDTTGDGIDNSLGLKISFTKATGLFRGTFNVYYDYISSENETTGKVTTKHTAVKVTYQGVALPARLDLADGYDGRGYFLMPAESSYMDVAGKECKYKFNWSYDFSLTKAYEEQPTDY